MEPSGGRFAAARLHHHCRSVSSGTTVIRAAGAPSGSESEPGSLVGCACGAVELCFHGQPAPLNRIWCCCFDCRQKNLWAQNQGGPRVPAACVSRERPMDLIYYANSFSVLKGQPQLEFFKLREGAGSTNCVTACCKTTILVDHVGCEPAPCRQPPPPPRYLSGRVH
eukprot:SAG22_NODE_4_length_44774_cov_362.122149_10_plen_167_part_00